MQKQQHQKTLLSELVSVLILLIVINHKLLARSLNVAFFYWFYDRDGHLLSFHLIKKKFKKNKQNGSAWKGEVWRNVELHYHRGHQGEL